MLSKFLPWLTMLLVFLSFLVMSAKVRDQEATQRQARLTAESRYLATQIDTDLDNRVGALERLAASWWRQRSIAPPELLHDVRRYLADVPGYQAIEGVDATHHVAWVYPLKGNEQAVHLNLGFEPLRKQAMLKAWATGLPQATAPVNLVQGGKGFLLFIPLAGFPQERYLLAVFRIQEWLDRVFRVDSSDSPFSRYQVSVVFDHSAVYHGPSTSKPFAESSLSVLGQTLTVNVVEKPGTVEPSLLPVALQGFGAVISVALALVLVIFFRSQRATQKVLASRRALEAEMQQKAVLETELNQVFTRMELATEAGQLGIWTWEAQTHHLTWNARMYELFDVPKAVIPTPEIWKSRLHPEDLDRVLELVARVMKGDAEFDTQFRVLRSCAVAYVRSAARIERDQAQVRQLTGLYWDTTEQRLLEEALRTSEERVRLLLNSTGEAIYGIDLEGICTFANPACARMLGWEDPQRLIGQSMHFLVHHSLPDGTPITLEECRIHSSYRSGIPVHTDDEWLWKADGTVFPVEYWSYPQVNDQGVQGAVVTFIDITERRATQKTIQHLATHDTLTDLPTLRLANDRLATALAQAKRRQEKTALLFIDLDGFKGVNDTWGHEAGDLVLKTVASRLSTLLRESDTAARIGGDEFLVILPNLVDHEATKLVAEKILEQILLPIPGDSWTAHVGASIGIAIYPEDADQAEELWRKADSAMYRVKKGGKKGIAFFSQIIGGSDLDDK